MGFLETPTTVSSITVKVIWAFAEDHDNQNGPCLESVACTNPELRTCKQMFATSECKETIHVHVIIIFIFIHAIHSFMILSLEYIL